MQDPHNGKAVASSAIASEIVKNFESLVRKSSRLFGSLRDLPQFGKYWSAHFQKTFEVYTKLWKYQQQHRAVLEDKEKYGLKRWEIGEIASKIGQLYYHYYLRTSDANYLQESLIFYEAIRARGYFKDVMDTKVPELMVKVMRYYARYIVVCLLLARRRVVVELVDELTRHVEDYIKTLKPPDAHEWHIVLQEITSFLQADSVMACAPPSLSSSASGSNPGAKEEPYYPPPRLDPNMRILPAFVPFPLSGPSVTLQQVILVGNHSTQVKFSELTLEMFRMMLALEVDSEHKDEAPAGADKIAAEGTPAADAKKRNPHKHLLYRPTAAQLLMFIGTVMKELYEGKAMLLYVCGDGLGKSNSPFFFPVDPNPSGSGSSGENNNNTTNNNNNTHPAPTTSETNENPPQPDTPATTTANPPTTSPTDAPQIYSSDGLAMHAGRPERYGRSMSLTSPRDAGAGGGTGLPLQLGEAIYPEDIRPFTRRPLFLIIDSESSTSFKSLQNNVFGQALVSLLSPTLTISLPKGQSQKGKFYTLFLYDPLSAFCALTGAARLPSQTIYQLTQLFYTAMETTLQLFINTPSVDPSFHCFMADEFLRVFMLRHTICYATLYLHRATRSRGPGALPASQPDLGDDVLRNSQLLDVVLQIASAAGVADQFHSASD
jgi:hypothetical protein